MNADEANLEVELAGARLPQANHQQLSLLLDWCVHQTEMSDDPHLQRVVVAPDAILADHASRILQEHADLTEVPSEVTSSSTAFALPVEIDDRLLTFIFLAESLVRRLEIGPPAYDELAGTLLEELLHAKHYTIVFNRRGYIHYPSTEGNACQRELLNFSFHFLDEYTVGRWKAEIINAELSYGESLPEAIDRGMNTLAITINHASAGLLEIQEAWSEVFRSLNSDVLGPLVRDAGRRALLAHKQSPAGDPSASKMFRSYVGPFWAEIAELLDTAFGSPSQADDKLNRFAHVLREFLAGLGIELSPLPNGGCWIDFNDSWSSMFQNSYESGT